MSVNAALVTESSKDRRIPVSTMTLMPVPKMATGGFDFDFSVQAEYNRVVPVQGLASEFVIGADRSHCGRIDLIGKLLGNFHQSVV